MTSATFRLPGLLAIQVAQVDQMSGGRVELGIGAGWFEQEHAAYGIPFPDTGERFDRLEEQLAIITGLWATRGRAFSLRRASTTGHRLARPAQAARRPGRRCSSAAAASGGRRRWPPGTPTSSTCRSSDEDGLRTQFDRVRAACEAIGRDPDDADLLQRAGAVRRQGRGGGRAPRGRRSATTRRPAREPARRHARARWSTRSAGTPSSGQPAALPADPRPPRPRPPAAGGRGDQACTC